MGMFLLLIQYLLNYVSLIDIADTLRYLLIGNPAEEEGREVSNNEVRKIILYFV